MRLLPADSLGYKVFDKVDRFFGYMIYGQYRWISAILGDKLKDGTASKLEIKVAQVIDTFTREKDHCLKNAGKP